MQSRKEQPSVTPSYMQNSPSSLYDVQDPVSCDIRLTYFFCTLPPVCPCLNQFGLSDRMLILLSPSAVPSSGPNKMLHLLWPLYANTFYLPKAIFDNFIISQIYNFVSQSQCLMFEHNNFLQSVYTSQSVDLHARHYNWCPVLNTKHIL